jgi:hypothetical protein
MTRMPLPAPGRMSAMAVDGCARSRPGAGIVLVTSRDGSEASWGPGCRRRRLASLPADEAALLFADHAKHRLELGSQDDVRKLAKRPGGLPLALKIAGSYLAESAEFLSRYICAAAAGYLWK